MAAIDIRQPSPLHRRGISRVQHVQSPVLKLLHSCMLTAIQVCHWSLLAGVGRIASVVNVHLKRKSGPLLFSRMRYSLSRNDDKTGRCTKGRNVLWDPSSSPTGTNYSKSESTSDQQQKSWLPTGGWWESVRLANLSCPLKMGIRDLRL
jgi:hypothetical protein